MAATDRAIAALVEAAELAFELGALPAALDEMAGHLDDVGRGATELLDLWASDRMTGIAPRGRS